MEQNLNHIKKTKMNDKEKAQAKLDKLLKDFEDCHRKAKRLKGYIVPTLKNLIASLYLASYI